MRDSQPSPLSIAQPRPPCLGAPSKADSEKSKTQSSESGELKTYFSTRTRTLESVLSRGGETVAIAVSSVN